VQTAELSRISGDLPDERGHFGPYGGVFVAETLIAALDELKAQYARYRDDPAFVAEFERELAHYVGRPSPVYHAERWSRELGGAQIWLKREDLNHTGAHKVNNCIGQALLAKRLGKRRVIAETGAGQHGVATSTVAARFGMECVVQMPEVAGRQPDAVIACVGGGSNAIGLFDGFIDDAGVRLIGIEAGGEKIAPGRHAARFAGGSPGVLQGTWTYILQYAACNIELTHSVSAGLDYAAVGPEHAALRDQ
jgi:tryptophan synthase beta subunit